MKVSSRLAGGVIYFGDGKKDGEEEEEVEMLEVVPENTLFPVQKADLNPGEIFGEDEDISNLELDALRTSTRWDGKKYLQHKTEPKP